jgi:hypothetical protein
VLNINVVAFENGVGNFRDVALVTAALRALGCTVSVTQVSVQARRRRRSPVLRGVVAARLWADSKRLTRTRKKKFDVNVMLEHVWPEQLPSAHRNVVIPNPEWFDRTDQDLLRLVDRVWAKTGHSFDAFTRLGCRVNLTGFDSEDRYDPDVARNEGFFHLAGKSRMKGTTRLVELWSTHPEWPTLTIVHSRKAAFEIVEARNIDYQTRYLADAELREIQNRHVFHLCLSETEGWGHYIGEAQSVGALLLTTDARPMNELVTQERGLLVESHESGMQHLAMTYSFDAAGLERAVGAALQMGEHERLRLGGAARAWFLENKVGFARRLNSALAEL